MPFHEYRTKSSVELVVKRKEVISGLDKCMRCLAIVGICLIALSDPVQAQQKKTASGAVEPAATRIVVDEETGVIRFFIEGEEKARLDAAGMHVRGNVNYGGALMDYGRSGFKSQADRKENESIGNGGQ